MEQYDPKTIEPKWQQVWEAERIFETPGPAPDEPADEPHWYQLEMLMTGAAHPMSNPPSGGHTRDELPRADGVASAEMLGVDGWTGLDYDGASADLMLQRQLLFLAGPVTSLPHAEQGGVHDDTLEASAIRSLATPRGPRRL